MESLIQTMLSRLVDTIRSMMASDSDPENTLDVCVECGDPTVPGAGRCGSCLKE